MRLLGVELEHQRAKERVERHGLAMARAMPLVSRTVEFSAATY
jgi:hypothetical protein